MSTGSGLVGENPPGPILGHFKPIFPWTRKSTARVSSRKYFIPGCVGRGLDLDLRIRPAAASGNPGYTDLALLGLRSKSKVFEQHGL